MNLFNDSTIQSGNDTILTSKHYTPGYGYSNASGPSVGGFGVSASPLIYSSTFFGSDVKSLLPPINMFGSRRLKRSKKSKRSKKIKKLKRTKKTKKSRRTKKTRK